VRLSLAAGLIEAALPAGVDGTGARPHCHPGLDGLLDETLGRHTRVHRLHAPGQLGAYCRRQDATRAVVMPRLDAPALEPADLAAAGEKAVGAGVRAEVAAGDEHHAGAQPGDGPGSRLHARPVLDR